MDIQDYLRYEALTRICNGPGCSQAHRDRLMILGETPTDGKTFCSWSCLAAWVTERMKDEARKAP